MSQAQANTEARHVFAGQSDEDVQSVYVATYVYVQAGHFTNREARDTRRWVVQEFVARHGEQYAADFVAAVAVAAHAA